jgi:hypothetical protein
MASCPCAKICNVILEGGDFVGDFLVREDGDFVGDFLVREDGDFVGDFLGYFGGDFLVREEERLRFLTKGGVP